MTIIFNLNGKQVGRVITSPGGVPYVDPGLMGIIRRIPAPVPMLPLLNPGAFSSVLESLPAMLLIPGYGVLTTQRLP